MKYYAGIGSRETPEEILFEMELIAQRLAAVDYCLRSGEAFGADKAFEIGCDKVNGIKEIFLSKHATKESIERSLNFHPNPKALKKQGDYVMGLMGRNMQIISGLNLDKNVDFVVCWTKDGKDTGGTGQAIRYSHSLGIPVFNLYNTAAQDLLLNIIENMERFNNVD